MTAPDDFGRALRRRRTSVVRRRILLVALAVAVIVVLGAGGYLLWFSSIFAVDRVEVVGVEVVTTEQVTQTAQVPIGEPLLRLDTDLIASRVASLEPVAEVSVDRDFPDAVVITVRERTVVYSRVGDAGFEWVDATGTVFRVTPEAAPEVPTATTEGTEERLLADVATVALHLPEEVRQRLATINARAVDDIELELTDGDIVMWGSADDSELKASVLHALITVDATVYDVSAPSNPTTR